MFDNYKSTALNTRRPQTSHNINSAASLMKHEVQRIEQSPETIIRNKYDQYID